MECDIDTGDHAPLSCQLFQVSPAKHVKIDAKIDKMLQLGVIEPSTSPWASRFFLVSQPSKEDREVVDYRPLNGITKKEVYPLPRIDDTLALLQGMKFVSSLDATRSFWQIKNTERVKQRSAFGHPNEAAARMRLAAYVFLAGSPPRGDIPSDNAGNHADTFMITYYK